MTVMKSYLFLFIAIWGEISGTSALKASEGFTRLYPSILAVLGYCVAFFFLSLAIRTIPVGIAYAFWAGIGIVLVAVIGAVMFDQHLNLPTMAGIGMILVGCVVVNLCSSGNIH